ncbi:hypothetical protein TraAM80_03675 [Trypanosoma rangeli]|uniref:Uncharacterized protein n=1 Tax=Trypanosoma rangeli TaxID=5698 RepID=A0A3R7KG27_TRYRA|nr:uncharacterized protein TraAM80_03675 [Trypanosoma rangeli]RNF07041.1 hypothetical protein TraAM80_03675 [Trypanosoma rangeli]|eukprot:RNF07041.1 hypothetical protein TraAM80_03675 [Trypanosoma rangeli]
MTGGISSDKGLYLGSIYHSLEHLPQWYQVIALSGLFFLFPLREIAVVGWLAVFLHRSFGTEIVWSAEYQRLLEQTSFNERICFTLYGVALSLLAFLSYRLFASGAVHRGLQESSLSGGRKWWPAAILCGLLGCEAMAFLRETVAQILSDPTSLGHLALRGFQGIENTTFDPFLVNINPHCVIQLEIFKVLLLSFLERVVPAVIIAALYRLLRDVPRRAHAAMRWYIVTIMLSRSLVEIYFMYRANEWEKLSSWILFVSTFVFLGMVNYAFGPSKRGGWTAATSVISSVNQTVQGIVKCAVLFFVICLCVLALVVSVHVVELLLIWLIFFLMMVWIPAIIDSCSTEYSLCIVTVISFIAHQMDYLTEVGSLRLWGLLSVWWLNLCLFYNFATNICRSRYGGIFAVSTLIVGSWRMTEHSGGTGDVVSILENSAAALRDLVEGALPASETDLVESDAELDVYTSVLNAGFTVCTLLILCIALLSLCEGKAVRSGLLGKNIVILTPGVLFRKFVKTFILAVCFLIFLVTGMLLYRVLPQLAMFTPEFFTLGMAVGLACTILGGLMDMQEFLYLSFMRVVGFMDPPAVNEDDKDIDRSSFLSGGNSGLPKS